MSEATNLCCVKCNSILDRATFQGLEVDLCPKCGGLWLDRGEITRAAKLPETELGRLRGLLTGAKGPPPVLLGSVHVDYCNKCHGIFLDRGELQSAVEAVRAKSRDTNPQEVVIAISTAGD
jgi:Zn-finger nucleic acid-binding protein